jgi:sulfane dehydrogenase subunit SoxC
MNTKSDDRRRFLKGSAALAGLAAGGLHSTTNGQTPTFPPAGGDERIIPYGERSRFETSARKGFPGAFTPLQDSMGIITPNPVHYVVSHGHWAPDIDPREHRLMIHGMVDRPLVFTLDELKRLPSVSRILFLQCAGSSYVTLAKRRTAKTVQETHGWTSCSEWTGVPLSLLLKEAGVKTRGRWIVAEDETTALSISVPLEKAMDDVILAYGQNGEAIRPHNGYPLRMVSPGFEGIRSPKWLRRIKVVDQPYMTKWETSVYTNLKPDGKGRWFQMQLEPNSVITSPSGEQLLPDRGFYEITGLAWSGGGAIQSVEVSTDGGRKWMKAELQEPIHRMAHTRFRFPWQWDGKEAILQSRCTDEHGDIQPTLTELNKIWGVNTDFWLSTKRGEHRIQHLNAVQPWRVKRDGSIENAIWEA